MKRLIILVTLCLLAASAAAQTSVRINSSIDWRYLPGNTVSTPTFGLGTGIDLILLKRVVVGASFDVSARNERSYFARYKPAPMSPYWFYFLSGRAGYRIRLDTALPVDLTPHAGAGLYMEPGYGCSETYNTLLAYAGIESDIMLGKHMALKAKLQMTATPDGRIGFNTGCGLSFLL